MGTPIPSKEVYHGRNASHELDKFVRCSRCAFPVKTTRDQAAPDGSRIGWGITDTAFEVVHDTYDDVQRSGKYYGGDTAYSFNTESLPYEAETTYDGAEATDPSYNGIEKSIYDPVLNTGCPQCGSLRYNR